MWVMPPPCSASGTSARAEGRYPTNQGFDEWYGIPNSTDESLWPTNEMFQKYRKLAEETGKTPMIKEEHIYSARKGSPTKVVKVYDCRQGQRSTVKSPTMPKTS